MDCTHYIRDLLVGGCNSSENVNLYINACVCSFKYLLCVWIECVTQNSASLRGSGSRWSYYSLKGK